MTESYKFTHTLTPEHYEAIGRVMTTTAALHQGMSVIAVCIATDSKRPWRDDLPVAVLTQGMSIRTLCGAMKTMVRIRYEDDAGDFDKLMDRILKIFAHRDLFAHCMWEKGNKPDEVSPIKASTIGSLRQTQMQSLKAKDIRIDAEMAASASIAFLGFAAKWDLIDPPGETDKTETE